MLKYKRKLKSSYNKLLYLIFTLKFIILFGVILLIYNYNYIPLKRLALFVSILVTILSVLMFFTKWLEDTGVRIDELEQQIERYNEQLENLEKFVGIEERLGVLQKQQEKIIRESEIENDENLQQ